MRLILSLLVMGGLHLAKAEIPRAESRAVDRVLKRMWPTAESTSRAELGADLADDVHRQSSGAHREDTYAHATLVGTLVRGAIASKEHALTPDQFASVLEGLVRAYQLASAESYDETNGVTCLAAGVTSGVVMLPLCAALAFYDSNVVSPALLDTTILVTAPLGTALGAISVLYGVLQTSDVGQKLWSLPGMAHLARKWPGSDQLGFFWSVVDQMLAEQPEWRAVRGAGELRPNQYLDRFRDVLVTLAPGRDLDRACAGLLADRT